MPEALQARYPLPDWVVDSKFKQGLTLTIAETIEKELEHPPACTGPAAQRDYAEHVTRVVLDALEPWLTWLDESSTERVSYPGDVLVAYIAQLAVTRHREVPDLDRYRELLRTYVRHLAQEARRYGGPAAPAG